MYIKRVGLAVSILFNVILCGYSNQTFSARNYDMKKRGKFNLVFLIDFVARIVFKDTNHCLVAWVYWYTRRSLSPELTKQELIDMYTNGDNNK